EPSFPLSLVRATRPGVSSDLMRELRDTFRAGDEEELQRQERREQRRRGERRRGRPAAKGTRQKARPPPSGAGAVGWDAGPASAVAAEVQQHLEALANADAEALCARSCAGESWQPVAQAAPITNGRNGAGVPERQTAPPVNGKRPPTRLLAR